MQVKHELIVQFPSIKADPCLTLDQKAKDNSNHLKSVGLQTLEIQMHTQTQTS